jgi:hypothetical protein
VLRVVGVEERHALSLAVDLSWRASGAAQSGGFVTPMTCPIQSG